jgi:Domain of unknown function (DUF4214)
VLSGTAIINGQTVGFSATPQLRGDPGHRGIARHRDQKKFFGTGRSPAPGRVRYDRPKRTFLLEPHADGWHANNFLASYGYGTLSASDFVSTLYQNLHMAPNAGGEASWASAVNHGASRASIMVGIANSPESIALTRT